jgi:hypothetical protein
VLQVLEWNRLQVVGLDKRLPDYRWQLWDDANENFLDTGRSSQISQHDLRHTRQLCNRSRQVPAAWIADAIQDKR